MNRPSIIGLCGGLSQSGLQSSREVSEALQKELGLIRVSPLDHVIKMVKALKKDGGDPTPSEINDCCAAGRGLDRMMWINLAIRSAPEGHPRILVDDLYFQEEIELVRELGGVVIQCAGVQDPMAKPDILLDAPADQLPSLAVERARSVLPV